MKPRTYFFLLSSLVIYACAPQSTLEEAKAKIKLQNEKLHQVVATKNIGLLKEVYDENANFLSPGAGIVKGRDSIIAQWKNGLESMLDMNSHSVDIGGNGDVVYEVGVVETKIKSSKKDTVFIYKAKYNNVWKRDKDGEYRLVVDIWNDMN